MDYLEKTLFPTLTENDIIIMDNMRTHHATAVTELAERLNIHILYLPPYSPDMNPIEKMWSKIKSILRKNPYLHSVANEFIISCKNSLQGERI